MRAARIGPFLLALGLIVGVAAGVGLLLGFEPAQLPRELLNIAAYKLTFLAAGGLLAAGALAVRYERRQRSTKAADTAPGHHKAAALAEGLRAAASSTEAHRPEPVANSGADRSDR
jgi:xylose isomerase